MRSRMMACAAVSLALVLGGAVWAQLVPNQGGGAAGGGAAAGGSAGGGLMRGPGGGGVNPMMMGGSGGGMMMGGMGGMMGGGMQQTADPKKARRLMNEALALLEKADKQMEDGNFTAARDAYKQAKEKMDEVRGTSSKTQAGAGGGMGGAAMPGMMGAGAMAGGPAGSGGGMMPGGGAMMGGMMGGGGMGGMGGGGLIAHDLAPENQKLLLEARKIHCRALRGLGNAWLEIAKGLMASPETFLDPWTTSQGQGGMMGGMMGGGMMGGMMGGGGGGGSVAGGPGGAM